MHHARRLSRFGVEASPRRSDSVNSLLPPTAAHSRRSSVSVSEYSATGAALVLTQWSLTCRPNTMGLYGIPCTACN